MTAASFRPTMPLFLALAGLWGWVMVRSGLWMVLEPPHVSDVSSRWFRVVGAVLVASGLFVFLLAARYCFPLASGKLKLVFELLPWIGLGVVVIGGLV